MNWGRPGAPFPTSLGARTPSHGHAQVSWLRRSLRPTSIPTSLTCWQGHLSGASGVPHLTGEASGDTVPSVGLAERQMDGAGGGKEEEDEGSASSREGVSQAPLALPLARLPSCLISSPCSRHPAGAGGQGRTKAALLTAPPRKGLFFSPSAFLFKPLSPRLGRGHRLISAGARWEQEGADGSRGAAGAPRAAAAASRRADARPTRGGLTGAGGRGHSRAARGGFLPAAHPNAHGAASTPGTKRVLGHQNVASKAEVRVGERRFPARQGLCWARSHCKGHGRTAAAFCPCWEYADPLALHCHGCSCPVLVQLGWGDKLPLLSRWVCSTQTRPRHHPW